MNIFYAKTGEKIADYNQWKSLYPKGKEGYSAWELGRFIMDNMGLDVIKTLISKALEQPVVFSDVYVEKGVKFDDYPRESQRDMVIEGEVNGHKLFVTVEAKCAEPFGGTIKSEYKSAIKYLKTHAKSQRAERIRNIYQRFFKTTEGMDTCELRYQLFHAAAATSQGYVDAEYRIMLILDFKDFASLNNLRRNKADYDNFLRAVNVNEKNEAFVLGNKVMFIYREV